MDLTFTRTDTEATQASHYTLRDITISDAHLQCFDLLATVYQQNYLMNSLKLDKNNEIYVSRIRLLTSAVNADTYVDNVWIGKAELRGELFVLLPD